MTSKGCVLDLRMHDKQGTNVHDYSRYGNDGTLTGCKWVENGLEFNGTSDYVDCGNDASLNITDSITLGAWVYPVGIVTGICQTMLAKRDSTVNHYSLIHLDGKMGCYIGQEGNNRRRYFTTPTLDENWHNVVITYDFPDIFLYLDGVQYTTHGAQTWSGYDVNYNLLIGTESLVPIRSFNGSIDEVRIYNYALSAAEIKRAYKREVHNYV